MFSLEHWERSPTWENWVGYVKATPKEKHAPRSVEELQEIIRGAQQQGRRLRVVGAGHSFSPVACPEEIAVTLHHLRGLVSADPEAGEVTLKAGTYLHEIGPMLLPHGLALENMGDVQEQSIAGAVSTGTHGTGISLGSLADSVMGWKWVDGQGTLHSHRRGDEPLSEALHLSLGLLGVLVELTLRVIPLYGLREESKILDFQRAVESFRADSKEHRHMEWFLFPGTDVVQRKTLSVVDAKAMSSWQKFMDWCEGVMMLNGLFYLGSELVRKDLRRAKKISQWTSKFIPNTRRRGYSFEVFPKPRGVRFHESEYFVSLDQAEACMQRVQAALRQDVKNNHFPIEVRTHKGESGYLSPTQGQDCLVLSFHMYQGVEYQEFFSWVREEMQPFQGRPHWGKVNLLRHAELVELYPQMKNFLELRERYDPNRVFMNGYLQSRILGEP